MVIVDPQEIRQLMKVFSQNIPVISALFPNKNLNLSEISNASGLDVGSISKSVKPLVDNHLVNVREVRGVGKPQKILALTEFSYKLFATINEYLNKEYITRGQSDKIIVDEYFKMLGGEDDEIRKLAADGLYRESTRNVFPEEGHLVKLSEQINSPLNKPLKKVFLQTLVNIASNTGDDKRTNLKTLFSEQLEEIFNDEGDGTDLAENLRILALNALSEILDPENRYSVLREGYMRLLEEGSIQASAARSLLLEKCSDHLTDVKLMLLRRYSSSEGDLRKRIGDELSQLK